MKLLIKQKTLSWNDSYDIFDEEGTTIFTVKEDYDFFTVFVSDHCGNPVGHISQEINRGLPKHEIYTGDSCVGYVKKRSSLFRLKFDIDYKGWKVKGNFFECDYAISNGNMEIAAVKKEVWNHTDTYAITVNNENDVVPVLMLVIAIDLAKYEYDCRDFIY